MKVGYGTGEEFTTRVSGEGGVGFKFSLAGGTSKQNLARATSLSLVHAHARGASFAIVVCFQQGDLFWRDFFYVQRWRDQG